MICHISLLLALLNLCLLCWILRDMRRQRHRAAVLKLLGTPDRRE